MAAWSRVSFVFVSYLKPQVSSILINTITPQAPIASPAPTPWPTYDPAATWSPTPDWDFEEPRRPCEGSTPDWKDVDGYGCEWYEAYDMPGCPFYGQDFGTEEGGVADDHCCFCEGTGVSALVCLS